jgi:uncharacterized protein YheU (UPF0270 family)
MREPPSQTTDPDAKGVELDPDQLSPTALRGLIEEFVLREGTDYGDPERAAGRASRLTREARQSEWSLEEKVAQVLRQLASGEARIVFDLELESASIVSSGRLIDASRAR